MYRIRIPARFSANGKVQDLYYKTKAEAEKDAAELRRKHSAGEIVRQDLMTPEMVRDARNAHALLAEAGVEMNLTDAVQLALKHVSIMQKSWTVSELIERYEADAREARGWSAKYISTWRQYSTRFAGEFGGRRAAELTPQELRDYFSGHYQSATYYNSAISVLSPAFAWAVKQQTLERSPFEFVEKRRPEQRETVDVFSVEEAQTLLRSADAHGVVIPFAIMLFAGIRPHELTRLRWEDFRVEQDGTLLLHVRPSVAKTRSVRLVHVHDPLKSVLLQCLSNGACGQIVPTNWERVAKRVRSEAGLKGRHDAARHSFASYSLAAGRSVAEVQSDMGHARGSDMLFKHYRGAVTPAAAHAYWALAIPRNDG